MKASHQSIFIPFALLGVSLLCQTHSFGQNPDDIKFWAGKEKTIPGHGMSKGEYPYDEGGKYRTEWVSVEAKSKTKYSVTVRDPIPKTSKDHSSFMLTQQAQEEAAKKKAAEDTKRRALAAKRKPPKRTAVAYNPYDNSSKKSVPQAKVVPQVDGYIGPYNKMPQTAETKTVVASNTYVRNDHSRHQRVAQPIRNTSSMVSYHRVNVGDTLYNISRKHGISVETLKKVNGLTSDLIRVGQSLRLVLAQHSLGMPRR